MNQTSHLSGDHIEATESGGEGKEEEEVEVEERDGGGGGY